jgi:hypothetical protein
VRRLLAYIHQFGVSPGELGARGLRPTRPCVPSSPLPSSEAFAALSPLLRRESKMRNPQFVPSH